MLGLAGGVLGLLLGGAALEGLLALSPPGLPRADQVGIDFLVVGFTVAATLATTVLFGLVPGLAARRGGAGGSLAAPGRGATAGRERHRLRRALVLAEIGIAVTIAAGAGVVVRRWVELVRTDPGFEVNGSLTLQLSTPGAEYASRESRWRFYARAMSAVAALAGVEAAGAVSALPLAQDAGDWGFRIDGRAPAPPGERNPFADLVIATPGYFEAMRIPLRAGRLLTPADAAGQPPVVVLSESVARRYWPRGDALGARIRLSSTVDPVWRTVVGIVGDVRSRGLAEAPRSEFFLPHAQFPSSPDANAAGTMSVVVRAAGGPAALAPAVREAIRRVDAGVPVSLVRTMEGVLDASLSVRRLQLLLLGFFAVAGLVLVAIGVYGVVAFLVEQRRREFGVRLALGARPAGIVRLVLRDALLLGAGGAALGAIGALAAGRVFRGVLPGVEGADPAALALVLTVVLGVVLAATVGPARRAARADPAAALQAD